MTPDSWALVAVTQAEGQTLPLNILTNCSGQNYDNRVLSDPANLPDLPNPIYSVSGVHCNRRQFVLK